MTARCHAFSCDDPLGGPEPTADLDGYPAHEDCVPQEPCGRCNKGTRGDHPYDCLDGVRNV